METRLIIAYALIALMAAAIAFVVWRHLTREDRRHRHILAKEARWEASRRAAAGAGEPAGEGH